MRLSRLLLLAQLELPLVPQRLLGVSNRARCPRPELLEPGLEQGRVQREQERRAQLEPGRVQQEPEQGLEWGRRAQLEPGLPVSLVLPNLLRLF